MNLSASIYQMNTQPMLSHINVGFGNDVSISEVAILIAKVVGYTGNIVFDSSKPDGTMRKLMDSARLETLGWQPQIELEQGLCLAYEDFIANHNKLRM